MDRKPTSSELEILQVLWSNGPCSVREVNELLAQKREVGYTTTLKLMQIMADKAIVTRDTSRRQHIYTAVLMEDAVQQSLLSKMINSAFHGSAMNLVMQALGNHKTSPQELEQIKALIKEIESDHK